MRYCRTATLPTAWLALIGIFVSCWTDVLMCQLWLHMSPIASPVQTAEFIVFAAVHAA